MTNILTRDFLIEVVNGNVEGYSIVHKFGRNVAIPNGSFVKLEIVASNPQFLSVPVKVRVAAGSAADTAAGANARSVVIEGIDTNLKRVTETLITAGTSPSASSVNTFWRVDRIFVGDVGTYGVSNAGVIVIEPSGGGTAIIGIAAGTGQSQHGVFTSQLGFTVEVLSAQLYVQANKPAESKLLFRENFNDTSAPMAPVKIAVFVDGALGPVDLRPRSPLRFDELTDIWVEASGTGVMTSASVDLELLVIDKQFQDLV